MNVATILQAKGHNVVTAHSTATLEEIARLLRDARIGAVMISPDRTRVQGILSERDIVRAVAEHGTDALSMKASAFMTEEVTTCGPEDHVAELMSVMTQKRIRHLPVCEHGALIGVISIGDVVKWRVEEIEHEAEALRDYVTHG